MNLSVARAFHRTHLVRSKGKKTSTHFPPIQQKKKQRREERGWVIYRQGRGIGPGSCHEPGPKLRGTPRVRHWSIGPGSWHEPGPMSPTEPGPMVHGALAARTGTSARHWSRFLPEPRLMAKQYSGRKVLFLLVVAFTDRL